jgi:hypothetical protein
MKQLLSLFLFLLPCLAWAQYPSNGNQKITLGEQTTADGLIWRGVAADTTLTVKSDTAAYFVLDTVNINLYTYKASATGKKWRQLGADTAAIAYVNTYDTQTVNGAKTFTSAVTATRFNPTANTVTGTGIFAPTSTSLGFSTNDVNRVTITSIGNFGLGVTPAAWASSEKAIQLPNDFVFAGGTSVGALFGINAYFESPTYKYLSNGQAVIVQTTKEGAFWIRRAPTGGPPNNATFSTSAYIDSTGNMILGNSTSPTQKLHVVGNGLFTGNVGIGSATPTTSGSGITFPATQSASTSANTLDDYEEGTWTPAYEGLAGSAGSLAYASGFPRGRYTKIGRLVVATGEIELTNKGSWSSGVRIAGLPFNLSATEIAQGFCIAGFVDFAAGELYLNTRNTGGASPLFYFDKTKDNAEREILFTTAVNNNSTFYFSLTYQTN